MGIAAIANDYLTGPFNYGVGKESTTTVGETINFGQKLQAENVIKNIKAHKAEDICISSITYAKLIAAHGKSLGMTIVTNNTREFERVEGLKVEDWSQE